MTQTETPTAEATGRLWVDRYRLIARVGGGGQGNIYRAHDITLDRTVAIKFPKFHRLADPKAAERFLREGRALAKLRHPNIVAVHDLGEHKGQAYLVTDWLEGCTLDFALRRRVWTSEESAALVEKLARALAFVHAQGLLHRDLKPSNIFIEPDGNPQIIDFGLARGIGDKADVTHSGEMLGTPGYAAPEQVAGGSVTLDARADVFSLGMVLYLMLARRLPFDGTPLQILRKTVELDAPAPAVFRTEIPDDHSAVCLQAIARDPKKRFASAEAFADALVARRAAPEFVRAVTRDRRMRSARGALRRHWPWLAGGVTLMVGMYFTLQFDRSVLGPQPDRKDRWVILPPDPSHANREPPPDTRRPIAPGLAAMEVVEEIAVGLETHRARWRIGGPAAALRTGEIDEPRVWIAGELRLEPMRESGAGEVFPITFVRFGTHWYCDPLTALATQFEGAIATMPARERADFVRDLLASVRKLRGEGKTLLHFDGPWTSARVRLWLARGPSLWGAAGRAVPELLTKLAEDFADPVEPILQPEPTAGSAVEAEAALRVDDALKRCDRMWETGTRIGRASAVRLLAALGSADGPWETPARQTAAITGRLRDRLPEWLGEVDPPQGARALGSDRSTPLARALRSLSRDPASAAEFARKIRLVEDRWRAADAESADRLAAWLRLCLGG